MILIFGGAWQGKLDFALDKWSLTPDDIYICTPEQSDFPKPGPIIHHLEEWVYGLTVKGEDPLIQIRQNLDQWREAIVICCDISCGLVPMDPVQRNWREQTSRCLSLLSQQAEQVYRIFCGIPTRLK